MKSLILIAIICLSISCSKSNSKKMEELKAVAEASVSGMTITLKADKSTGSKMYGWSISPATGVKWNTMTYHVGEDFVNVVVTVPTKQRYTATLIVYDHQNISQLPGGGNSNSASIEIDVK